MARFQRYTKKVAASLLAHNNRKAGDIVERRNEDIDPERTYLNYHLVQGDYSDLQEELNSIYYPHRKDSPVLCELVVTLPKHIPEQDEKQFFQHIVDFMRKEGLTIISAVVHKDEATPHLHLDMVPKTDFDPYACAGKQKNYILQRAKEVKPDLRPGDIVKRFDNRFPDLMYMKKFHAVLNQYVSEKMGYDAGIINGATENGAMSVTRLKLKTMQEQMAEMNKLFQTRMEVLSRKEAQVKGDLNILNATCKQIQQYVDSNKEYLARPDAVPLSDWPQYDWDAIRTDDHNRAEAAINIINQHQLQLTPDEIDALRPQPLKLIAGAKYQTIPYHLQQEYLTDNSLVVISAENIVSNGFKSRQMNTLIKPLGILRTYRTFLSHKTDMEVLPLDNLTVVFLRSESEQQALLNMLRLRDWLDQEYEEGRRYATIYAEQMDLDRSNVFGTIMRDCHEPVVFGQYNESVVRDEDGELLPAYRIEWT